ncbi:MAG: hypothetical protein KAI24_12090, partial [Planctomycetes bacterium]|nr:hypothetical protein [Planctomycetota bacterium]
GGKASVYEGGIRSPLWVRWPGVADPALRIDRIAAHVDLLPTICEMVDAAAPTDRAIDGRSLAPLLRGRSAEWPERHLVLQTHRGDVPQPGHHFAVLGQRYKLVRASGFSRPAAPPDHPTQLFDLSTDPGEQSDVAAANPETVRRLRQIYDAWWRDVSTTRDDNFAKPRIHVGTAHEAVTTLTRQDWVAGDGVGWGHDGRWLLHLDRARKVDVTVRFRQPRVVERTTIHAGGRPIVERRLVESDRITFEAVPFAVGDVDLRITCTDGETTVAPYQVVLQPR